jgi:hypothetical protein
MLLLFTASPHHSSQAKPHCLTYQHQRVRAVIRYTSEHVFVGDPNYMGDSGSLSRQKNDLISRKTDLLNRSKGA